MKIDGFNQENYEIELKYDFERWRHKYSVIVIPLQDRASMVSDDTNDVLKSLTEIVQENQLEITNDAVAKFVELFNTNLETAINEKGDNIIFSFSVIKEVEFLYSAYLSQNRESKIVEKVSLEEINAFLEA